MATMYLNGRETFAAFGLRVGDPVGLMGPPGQVDQLLPVPGRMGHARVSREASVGPRRFTVPGVLRAASAAANALAWDAFLQMMNNEELEVYFGAWPDRVATGVRYEGIDTQEVPALYTGRAFTMSFVAADPLKYDRYPDVYTFSSGSEWPLVLGSAPSDVSFRLIGTGTPTPPVIYRDAQGMIRGLIAFPLTLPDLQWIDYDGTWQLAELHTSAAAVPVDVAAVGGPFFVADPADGDAVQGPTLQAVNCAMVAHVRKAWL
jgi:hypothetical protein